MTRGRPRAFDPEAALDKALLVFWQKGYEGASLSDLTGAMGISRPSLYAAFGDKQALFRKALDRYMAGPAGEPLAALEEIADTRLAVDGFLRRTAASLTDRTHPPGCLVVHGALSCSAESAPAAGALLDCRNAMEDRLRARLERGIALGHLPEGTDAAALARFYAAVMQGMAVQAKGGAGRAALLAVTDMAMNAWPATRTG